MSHTVASHQDEQRRMNEEKARLETTARMGIVACGESEAKANAMIARVLAHLREKEIESKSAAAQAESALVAIKQQADV